jgi:hypothetical protein
MFEPTIVTARHPITGEEYEAQEYPSCHVCGRVLTEEDHTDEAGTDGEVFWDQYHHSPEGLEEILGVLAFMEFEKVRVEEESQTRLQAMIDDAVREAMKSR